MPDEWIIVEKAIDGKKGAVKFTTPEFKFLQSLSDDEMSLADECFNTLEIFLKAYLVKGEPVVETLEDIRNEIEKNIDEEEHDDLPY